MALRAAPGDTTVVQAQYDRWLTNVGNYDTAVVFPDGSLTYRKIYMVFTLGKYQCPGNPQYCGDWDYMAQTFVMTPGGDTLELGRLITPYANATSNPRTPWGWRERYFYDVTDYYPVLRNNATVRIRYSGGTGGFTAHVQFLFVEGTPPRDVLGVTPLWRGDIYYGSATYPLSASLPALSRTAPAGTQRAAMRLLITGHRGDNNGCSEFCKKYYRLLVNGNLVVQKDIWRDDCGWNRMYPQSGTWVYNRGNWCPGDRVLTNEHALDAVTAGNGYTIDLDLEPYTTTATAPPYYTVSSAAIYYGGMNKTLDASVEDIIAPTDNEAYFRENPLSGTPRIRVQNTGGTPVTSLKISYGISGSSRTEHTWTGTLAPLEEAELVLPEPPGLREAVGTANVFSVRIMQVNGRADDDATNDSIRSSFTAAPQWPGRIAVSFKTNASSKNGVSETEWQLLDANGTAVAQRTGNSVNRQYADTVSLAPGSYRLVVTDQGCDGLYWWANASAGRGSLAVTSALTGQALGLNGYFSGDFGCGFTQYFSTAGLTGVQETATAAGTAGMEVWPNPARSSVTVAIRGGTGGAGKLVVLNALGQVVATQAVSGDTFTLRTETWPGGVYTAAYYHAAGKLTAPFLLVR